MDVIHQPLTSVRPGLSKIVLAVDRHTLAKRRWRGTAADHREFGFDLARPLRHEEPFFQSDACYYAISQEFEALLAVSILDPEQIARVAWQIGNLHFPLAINRSVVLIEDDIALRQMFEREKIEFRTVRDVFQPLSAAMGHRHHDHEHHDH